MEANILRILVVLLGMAVVAVVLFQQPKEGGMGAFTGGGGGSGASSTVFGAKGSGSFLFRLTAGVMLAFAIFIVVLVKVTNSDLSGSVLSAPVVEAEAIPGAESSTTGNADSAMPESTSGNENDNEFIPGSTDSSSSNIVPADSIPGETSNTSTDDAVPENSTVTETETSIDDNGTDTTTGNETDTTSVQ